MSSKVAAVIPTYKDELNPLEKISLAQCRKVLGKYPLIFVAPEGKNFSYFEPCDGIVYFPPQYFRSVKTYSRLLLSPFFYEAFDEFEYILIYQLDAFVFYDALEIFCSLGWDYIGAPWPYYSWSGWRKPTPRVGNGGFSLRKVRACRRLLNEVAALPNGKEFFEYTEDAFFAFFGVQSDVNFTTAPVAVAKAFSMEHHPAKFMRKFKNLPFGCHNWHRFGADFYVELFAQFGYDLRPFRMQMGDEDCTRYTLNGLEILAMERLVRRAERGQSIINYLPTNCFASVRVLRSPRVMKILARLLLEDELPAEKIFIYAESDWRKLVDDVTREDLPHLVLTLDDDDELIEFIERRGLLYGRHVVSFQRECLKHYEKIFHNLGK